MSNKQTVFYIVCSFFEVTSVWNMKKRDLISVMTSFSCRMTMAHLIQHFFSCAHRALFLRYSCPYIRHINVAFALVVDEPAIFLAYFSSSAEDNAFCCLKLSLLNLSLKLTLLNFSRNFSTPQKNCTNKKQHFSQEFLTERQK